MSSRILLCNILLIILSFFSFLLALMFIGEFGTNGVYTFFVVGTLGWGIFLVIGTLAQWKILIDPPLDKFPFLYIYPHQFFRDIKESHPMFYYYVHLFSGFMSIVISMILLWTLFIQTKGFKQW